LSFEGMEGLKARCCGAWLSTRHPALAKALCASL
jgi:hypothetical protein